MRQRGRKSADAEAAEVLRFGKAKKLAAPDELTAAEAQIWQQVVECMPGDWFTPDNVPLLVQYCRHTIQARRVASMIQALDDAVAREKKPGYVYAGQYDDLYKMAERESRAVANLATKMRLSQQATVTKNKRKNAEVSPGKQPWDR